MRDVLLKVLSYYHNDYESYNSPLEKWKDYIKEEEEEVEAEEAEEEAEEKEKEKEKEEARKIAPEKVQEQLKENVLKNRSTSTRLLALEKLPNDFIEEQVRNKKQHKKVRERGLSLLKNNKELVDDMARNADYDGLKHKAIELTTNPKILLEDFKKTGNEESLWKLDEDTVVKNLPKKINRPWGASKFINKVKKSETAEKLINQGIESLSLLKLLDESVLKKIYPKVKEELQKTYIIIKLQDDKAFLKKIIQEEKPSDIADLILNILDDQNEFKKFVEKYPKDFRLEYPMSQIKDSDFLKKYILENKIQSVPDKVLDNIKDDDFLKKYYEETGNTSALKNVEDDEYIKREFAKENDVNVLRHIKDEQLLKEWYDKHIPAKGLSKYQKSPLDRNRKATLPNIQDQKFLEKVAKKDSNFEVRLEALKLIRDPEVLQNIISKEKSKNALITMLESVKDQRVLLDILRKKSKDTESDIRFKIYNLLNQESIVEVLKTLPDYSPSYSIVERIEDKTLRDILLNSKSRAEDYYGIYQDDEDFLLSLINKHGIAETLINSISNEEVIKKLLSDPDVLDEFHELGELSDPELIKYVLLNKNFRYNDPDIFDLLSNIDLDDDFIKEALTSASPITQKNIINFIEDKDILIDKMLDEKTDFEVSNDIFKKIWKEVKKDQSVVEKIANKTKNPKIIKGILPALKNNDKLLKTTLRNVKGDELKIKIMSLMKDKSLILEEIPNLSRWYLKNIEPELIKRVVYENKDLDINQASNLIDTLEKVDAVEAFKQTPSLAVKTYLVLNYVIPEEIITDKFIEKAIKIAGDSNKIELLSLLKDESIIMKAIPEIDNRWDLEKIRNQNLINRTLVENPDINYDQAEMLIDYLLDNHVISTEDMYKKAASTSVKEVVILYMPPDKFTENMVDDFMNAMRRTDSPYEVDKQLIKKAYDLSSDEQQDSLQGFLPRKDLLPRHREAIDSPYKSAKRSDEPKVIKRFDHPVEKNPINQVYRLLVHLARY